MDFLEIIDEWHREYFPPSQSVESSDENTDDSDISTASENESNENILEQRIQLVHPDNDQNKNLNSEEEDWENNNLDLTIREKIIKGCSCRMDCISNISFEEISHHIYSMRELSKEEKDMYIMGKLKSKSYGGGSSRRDAKRQRYEYNFDDREVCTDVFLFLHDIGEKHFKNLVKHMKTHGIKPRTHGNIGKKPHNALSFEEIKFVVQFINRYSEDNGLPMPAAPRGRDSEPPIFLPCSTPKNEIHQLYVEACHEVQIRAVKLSSFYSIWSACLPNIQIANPRSDVCNTCERHREHILNARSENEKLTAARNFTDHIEKAEREHHLYIQCIKEAREEHQSIQLPEPPVRPCSTDFLKTHYTFDFAQCVSVPHHFRQVGPLFFETPRKIQIFGICMEGAGSQRNYLIDEDQTIGRDGKNAHGPNTVISILHHHFQNYSMGEKCAVLHCDNCPGQNKNRYVIGYLLWRVMIGLHRAIELHMQIPGHTKCQVDAGFAQIKKKYRRSDCDTLQHVADVVSKSSKSNEAVIIEDGNVKYYEWKEYIKTTFQPLKGIRKFHYFTFSALLPGVVLCSVDVDGDKVPVILSNHDQISVNLPPEIMPGGLSRERQEYLYKHIRPHVRECFRDTTCPEFHEE
ncbi:uncharacterized protein LOC130049247 isoform X2 [Ostrea edulis]|uniref:uncharacterized protein LOC130049247 isoform X2 n=1 Tax=Ostrea edulis TaxID=37623 RepID=UPI0024AF4608|nr:uncharacterized protein LOC130049247 isoform X2 [Ostrea edulis]